MADRVIKVLTPADNYDLISLEEIKDLFGIPDADTSQDELLATYITSFSDLIATLCNRVFAYEQVSEIWRCVEHDQTNAMTRLFLSHYPLDLEAPLLVESPTGSMLDPLTYEVEAKSGKIELLQTYAEPIFVTYSGGYLLPDDAPPALKQATALMARQGQAMMNRLAVSGIRSIAHKDSRVQYFDANQSVSKVPGGGLNVTDGLINSLLSHYIRYEV